MDKILRRGIANNKDKILSGTDILRFLENDKAAGVLLMCRQLNMSICGLYQCAPDDPADSSSAFVMAFDDGIIRKKEKKKLADMMEFRRECSFMLNVELPSDRTVYDWYELTMRIMSRCYGIKINDKPR